MQQVNYKRKREEKRAHHAKHIHGTVFNLIIPDPCRDERREREKEIEKIEIDREAYIPQTDSQTDKQTDSQADKQTDRQTAKHTDRQTDRQTEIQTEIQTERQPD